MIIVIGESGVLGLRDPDDFRRFEIEVESAGLSRATVVTALASLGEIIDEGHAWIGEEALVKLAGRERDAEWLASFAAMKDKARKFGWVDDNRRAIRAHIRWQPREESAS